MTARAAAIHTIGQLETDGFRCTVRVYRSGVVSLLRESIMPGSRNGEQRVSDAGAGDLDKASDAEYLNELVWRMHQGLIPARIVCRGEVVPEWDREGRE